MREETGREKRREVLGSHLGFCDSASDLASPVSCACVVHARMGDGEDDLEPRTPIDSKTADPFMHLQAILAGLPMYALRADHHCGLCCCAPHRGGCLPCGEPQVIEHMPWVLPCHDRVEVALLHARSDYPRYRKELSRLRIAHSSHDLTIFVDDEEKRMFTSLRGTDFRTCRDLCNDLLIICGCWLCRTKWSREEYCHTRRAFPNYKSYGCGHSLGGTVMTEMSQLLEDTEFAFDRVDVFNTGSSPFGGNFSDFKVTQYNSHRVQGDVVSRYFRAPGMSVEHPARPEFCSHSLQHFLPERHLGEMLHDAEVWVEGCCTEFRVSAITGADIVARRVTSSANLVAVGVQEGADLLAGGAGLFAHGVYDGAGLVANGVQEGAHLVCRQVSDVAHELQQILHSSEFNLGEVIPEALPPSSRCASVAGQPGTFDDAGSAVCAPPKLSNNNF